MNIKELKQLNVKELFASDQVYKIPDYQRPYAWKEDQVNQFFEDITGAMDREETEYFLGSLILIDSNNATPILDIVDGQQRATTIIILLALLRDLLKEQNEDLAMEIQSQYLISGIYPRLQTRTEDATAYERAFLQLDNPVVDQDLMRLPKAFRTSVEVLKKLLLEKCEEQENYAKQLFEYLTQNVTLVVMISPELSSAYTIFETINNRGTALEAKDLLKNFLINELSKEYPKALFSDQIQIFKSNWQKVEASSLSMNNSLILHREAITGVRTRKDLFKEMTTLFKEKKMSTNQFMDDWLLSVESYERVVHGDLFAEINFEAKNNIHLLEQDNLRYWQSVLTSAVRKGYSTPDLSELVFHIERVFSLTRIAGYATSKLRDVFLNLIKNYLHEKRSIHDIAIFLDQFTARYRIVERAMQNLTSDCYHQNWCRYVLAKYEYGLADASVERIIRFNRTVQIEHILPQRMTSEEWTVHFSPEEHDRLVHSLGNLCLLIGNTKELKGSKNQKASNKPFAQKLEIYTGIAQKDGTSAFYMTSALAQYPEWTPNIIEKRGRIIIDDLMAMWRIDESYKQIIEKAQQEGLESAKRDIDFSQGHYPEGELKERIKITLLEGSVISKRLQALLEILVVSDTALSREEIKEALYEKGIGESVGQAGRYLSNISQTITRPQNAHLRQIIQFEADVFLPGARKNHYFIPTEYKLFVRGILEEI